MDYDTVNITGIVKDEHEPYETYLFIWCDSRKQDLLRQFGLFASNPELSFSWYDAAKASSNISDLQQKICHCLASAASRIEDLPPRHLNAGACWLIHCGGQPVGKWEFKKGSMQ